MSWAGIGTIEGFVKIIGPLFGHTYCKVCALVGLDNNCYMEKLSDSDKGIQVTFHEPMRIR